MTDFDFALDRHAQTRDGTFIEQPADERDAVRHAVFLGSAVDVARSMPKVSNS